MESEMESMMMQRRRAGNAVIAVTVVVMALVTSCIFSSKALAGAEEEPLATQVWESMRRGSDIADALESVGLTALDRSALPAWFREEVFMPQQQWDVWANDDRSVVRLSVDGKTSRVRAWIEDQLQGNGWVLCPSGMDDMATCMKKGGSCRWIATQFGETEDSAEVVLRILRS